MPNERISMSKLKQLIGPQAEQFGRSRGPRVGRLVCPSGRSSKYLTGPARLRNRHCRGRQAIRSGTRTAGVSVSTAPAPSGHPGWPRTARGSMGELKRHRHVTLQTAVGGVQRRIWRRGLPTQRLLPDLPGLGRSGLKRSMGQNPRPLGPSKFNRIEPQDPPAN